MLRLRAGDLSLEPWLAAIEAGRLAPEPDLLEALAAHLDGAAVARLLRWWLAQPCGDPALPQRIGRCRDAAVARELRRGLADFPAPAVRAALLPLLGHQRSAADFPLLRQATLEVAPAAVRHAALEGLCVGLGAWPLPALRSTLLALTTDLDPALAAAAVDGLARLPGARASLLQLRSRALDGAVAARLERRLARLPANPLLLLVHGRAGGAIPAEVEALAVELQQRRGAPVLLRALTDGGPLELPRLGAPLGLVPLLLLPGEHVRQDLPRLRQALTAWGPLRSLPFLGSWPAWQRALGQELAHLANTGGWSSASPALLLHHPIGSPLGRRYLDHLEAVTGARSREAAYSSGQSLDSLLSHPGPVLPLALAANRLTEALAPSLGPAADPLLARPLLRQALLEQLEVLP
jgi:sirohydrochlorin ferrochelatase